MDAVQYPGVRNGAWDIREIEDIKENEDIRENEETRELENISD